MVTVLENTRLRLERKMSTFGLVEKSGQVVRVVGLVIESIGPQVGLGEICQVRPSERGKAFLAEVVGFRDERVLLMPLEEVDRLEPGAQVAAVSHLSVAPAGRGLLGRVLDGFGRPIDGLGPLAADGEAPLKRRAPCPLRRSRIERPMTTGIRAVDAFTPVGNGQRLGIFAGSGVGKSTLLGMMAKGSSADVNVIALVGERGRELREFLENELGPEGLERSVVVVTTSDEPASLRLRAAFLATAIAEAFRDDGLDVLFMMDSLTRFAMAQREIGLAVGEPPATRGYPPSVFSLVPRLLERTGCSEKGAITALYTILVEGDDMNEPVADLARGILDGHIVLSRALATANHFPAIDVLESVSRLTRDICSPEEIELVSRARDLLALYRKNEDMITIGAYVEGNHPRLDQAVRKHEVLRDFLQQGVDERSDRTETYSRLKEVLS